MWRVDFNEADLAPEVLASEELARDAGDYKSHGEKSGNSRVNLKDIGVPREFAVHVVHRTWRMKGSDDPSPRCSALQGEIGKNARCKIYPLRPGPCHELEVASDACNRARRRHGLNAIG